MTGDQARMFEPNATDERAEENDTAERCDDPTPRGVIRAALEAAICLDVEIGPMLGCDPADMFGQAETGVPLTLYEATNSRPARVLDVGAGYGAWSSELRRLAQGQGWPVHITGVELLAAREKHGRKWCDEWLTCDWHRASEMHVAYSMDPGSDAYDLVIGNPPFDELTGPKGAKRPPEECMPAVLLRHAPAVLLLHTQQAFLKSEAGRASWRHNPPAASWLVPGGVSFRGPGKGSDSTCYQVTLWLRDHAGPCSVYMLDDLSPGERSWTVPPGTEEPSKCEAGCWPSFGSGVHKVDVKVMGDPQGGCKTCPDCGGTGLDPNGDLPSAPGYQP